MIASRCSAAGCALLQGFSGTLFHAPIDADTGEAEAIFRRAEATARGLDEVSRAIGSSGGASAAAYELAEQYVAAFKVCDIALISTMRSDSFCCVSQK